MVRAVVDVVDLDVAPIRPMPTPALFAPSDVANVLVRLPHVVAADAARPRRAPTVLDKNSTATRLVAPAVPIEGRVPIVKTLATVPSLMEPS